MEIVGSLLGSNNNPPTFFLFFKGKEKDMLPSFPFWKSIGCYPSLLGNGQCPILEDCSEPLLGAPTGTLAGLRAFWSTSMTVSQLIIFWHFSNHQKSLFRRKRKGKLLLIFGN